MKSILYRLPSAAEYGRVIPKSKILEHSSKNGRLKQMFVEQVERIEWSHKLSPETVNLSVVNDVYEIQIISIIQRKAELNLDILQAVDRVIPSRVIFITEFESKIRYIAAYKRRNEADKTKQVISSYFYTDWVEPEKAEVIDLPIALNLYGMYERLLLSILPIEKKDGESLSELIERYEIIQKLKKDVTVLEKKMLSEKQFNRKVEMNGELKQLQEALGELV